MKMAKYIVACLLKARNVTAPETAVAMEWLYENSRY
jgi:hypothetical protein